uniref:Uncharacterized protein n=1 Tax=Geospiza parvula TaxID=87175 RepID=A0A8U8BLD2_GEOPR
SLLILLQSLQEISADTVTQEDGPVTVKQGHPFHTTCKYHTSQAPELISYQAGTGPKRSGRFTTYLNTTGKSSVLQLEEVELSDSALYLYSSRSSLLTFVPPPLPSYGFFPQ